MHTPRWLAGVGLITNFEGSDCASFDGATMSFIFAAASATGAGAGMFGLTESMRNVASSRLP
jgi:hypothetical protein